MCAFAILAEIVGHLGPHGVRHFVYANTKILIVQSSIDILWRYGLPLFCHIFPLKMRKLSIDPLTWLKW